LEADRSRKSPVAEARVSAPEASFSSAPTVTSGALALAAQPAPLPAPAPSGPQLVTQPPPAAGFDLQALQRKLSSALDAVKGHQSAAQQLEEATLVLNDGVLEIQTSVSTATLTALFNPEADRILKAALREAHPAPLQLKWLPGTASAAAPASRSTRPAAAGTAAELAERHPLVQEARRLFSAEISNVIDLRDKP
jgi:DNA polymerase-3 subunit gamma/tau